ncbi:hypothetical protein TNCV_4300361 [Trichonephila clavipes]|nr:hypothetical protein TNCV_4300361 [Trichonephila clavipes]
MDGSLDTDLDKGGEGIYLIHPNGESYKTLMGKISSKLTCELMAIKVAEQLIVQVAFYCSQTLDLHPSLLWCVEEEQVSCDRRSIVDLCHTPRHRIKETLDLSFGFSRPCRFHLFKS